jgi:tetratricopeptide (TPR) repeat protein
MYNLLISLAAGVAVAVAIALGSSFGWIAAFFPGFLVTAGLYVYFGIRTKKRFEEIHGRAVAEIQAGRVDAGVQLIGSALPLGRWQFGMGTTLHGIMGAYRYMGTGDVEASLGDLELGCQTNALSRLLPRDWTVNGVLACARYRKHDLKGALEILEEAAKGGAKDPMIWSIYAWILEKEGQHEEAIKVLGRATALLPKDEKLQDSLQSLQNGKKLKLWKHYPMQWYQYRLEAPPAVDPTGGRARRQVFRRR